MTSSASVPEVSLKSCECLEKDRCKPKTTICGLHLLEIHNSGSYQLQVNIWKQEEKLCL